MELNEFIKEAVLQAIKGVEEARMDSAPLNSGFNSESEPTEIEITAFFGLDEGKLVPNFGEGSSKIKMKVPVRFPKQGK